MKTHYEIEARDKRSGAKWESVTRDWGYEHSISMTIKRNAILEKREFEEANHECTFRIVKVKETREVVG